MKATIHMYLIAQLKWYVLFRAFPSSSYYQEAFSHSQLTKSPSGYETVNEASNSDIYTFHPNCARFHGVSSADNFTVNKLTVINVPFDVHMFCKYFYLHNTNYILLRVKKSVWGKHSVIHKRRSLVVDT